MTRNILIVEDEQDLAKVLGKRIQHAGYQVSVASDAMIAVKLAHDQKPDLIVLDLMLPAGGGLSVLQRLKMSSQTNLIPVIVITGMEDQSYEAKVKAMGVEGYMKKPCDTDLLLAEIRKLLRS